MATAEPAAEILRTKAEDGGADARITHREAEALVQLARGSATAATQLMDEAIEIAEGQRPPNGPASPIKPPYQLYEEILLELNRPARRARKVRDVIAADAEAGALAAWGRPRGDQEWGSTHGPGALRRLDGDLA